jgi:hypothetical protein
MHWFATDMGAAGESRLLNTQIIRDIARDDEATEKLLRVLNHDIRPSELFTPRRVGKALARAARRRPDQIPLLIKQVALELRREVRRSRQRRLPLASADPASWYRTATETPTAITGSSEGGAVRAVPGLAWKVKSPRPMSLVTATRPYSVGATIDRLLASLETDRSEILERMDGLLEAIVVEAIAPA